MMKYGIYKETHFASFANYLKSFPVQGSIIVQLFSNPDV